MLELWNALSPAYGAMLIAALIAAVVKFGIDQVKTRTVMFAGETKRARKKRVLALQSVLAMFTVAIFTQLGWPLDLVGVIAGGVYGSQIGHLAVGAFTKDTRVSGTE